MTAQPIINSLDFARLQPLLTGAFRTSNRMAWALR